MATIKNPPIIAIGAGRGKVANGVLKSYYSNNGEIPANTFVVIVSDHKIGPAVSIKIDGITQEICTESKAGKVWVYGDD